MIFQVQINIIVNNAKQNQMQKRDFYFKHLHKL